MPERDITLDMGVNSKDALKAMNDFERAAKRLSQVLSHTSQPSKELQKSFTNIRKTASTYNSTLRRLQSDTDKYSSAVSKQLELERRLDLQRRSLANKEEKTSQFVDKKLQEIEVIEEQINKYNELIAVIKQQDDLRTKASRDAIGAAMTNAGVESLPGSSEEKVQKVNALIAEQGQKILEIKAKIDNSVLSYEKQANAVQNTSNRLDAQKAKVSKLYDDLEKGTNKLTAQSGEFAQIVGKTDIQNTFNNIRNVVKGLVSDFKKFVSILRKAVSLVGRISGISSLLKNFKSSLGGSNMELKDAVKYLIQYGLGFRSLYFLVRKLRSTFVDALEDMGKSIPQVQASLDSLSKSMNTLRGGLAVAFAPLLKYVAALMERLAAIAINAANAIAQFFAVITGQNVWFKMASSVSGYTDAVKGSTKATKDNEKELKKQLAAFDDIDVLVKDLDDDLENATPGGSGGASGSELGTWQQVANPISELAELIKKAWASDDTLKAFEEVGIYIGNALQKALDNLLTDFWPPLREKAEKVALAIAGTINGFFQTDAVVSFAKNIAAALNTALSTMSNYWNGVNWGNMGAKLRESIEALIDSIEWNTLAEYLKGKIKGMFELAYNIIGDGSWIKKLANNISGVIEYILKNVDFKQLGSTINTFLTSLFDGITEILRKNGKGIDKAVSDFVEGLKPTEILLSLGKMIFELIKLALKEGFKLLMSSNVLLPLLIGFLTFELGKAALKTFLVGKIATLLGGALTTAVGDATVGSAIVSAAGTLFTSFSASLTAAFAPLAAILAGLIGGALLGAYINNEVLPSSVEIMQNAMVSEVQTMMDNINYTIASSEPQLLETVTGIVTNMGIVEQGYHASSLADFNNYVGQIIQGYGFTESEVVSIFSSMYSSLGYDMSSFTGTTIAQLSAFIGNIISKSSEVESGINTDTSNIQSNVQETESTAEESSQGFVKSFEDMATGVSDAAAAIASTPIKPIIDTSSIDAGIAKLNTFLSLAAQAGSASSSVSMGKITTTIRHNTGSISRLAKGGVIPPNKPFLAMLGDQTSGTNVEAPLSTITEALQSALASYGFSGVGGNQEIVLNIDGATLARLTVPYNLDELNRKGYNVKVLERK